MPTGYLQRAVIKHKIRPLTQPLTGACILVTRPRGQSDALLVKLRSAGAQVLHCPVIEILDQHQTRENLAKATQLSRYQAVIFISRNAVKYGLHLMYAADTAAADLPPVGAIGRSTAALLQQHQVRVAACPNVPDSAALAETPVMRGLNAGSRVLIFRGKGGRETLAKIFAARRIETDYAEVYQRIRPTNQTVPVTTPAGRKIDLIMLSSRDSLQNLHIMTPLKDRRKLLETPLLLGSPTMLDLVDKLGFQSPPIIAPSPLDDDMLAQAIDWWQHQNSLSAQ